MFERGDKPRKGQRFWDGDRPAPDRNGEVIRVLREDDEWDVWEEGEVIVQFPSGKTESYIFEDIDGKWTDKFGGTWMVNE